MRKSSLIPVLLVTIIVLCGCQGTGRKPTVRSPRPLSMPVQPRTTKLDADETYRLHDKDLERLGLEIFWTEKLYAQPTVRLIDAYLLEDLIIMETTDQRLYGVDRKTGAPKWMVELPNRCDFRGCEDKDQIYVPCRNTLLAIDKRGFVTWRRVLRFAPGGAPAADAEHVYLPCFDGRIRAFLKDKGYFAWQYTTTGELEAQPAIGSRLVYVGSNDGFLYALTTEKLDLSWSFKTYDAIRAPIVFGERRGERRVYVSSTDGSLYSLVDMPQATREQQLAWPRPYATGASITQPPRVAQDMVLVVNIKRECHAADRSSGKRLWVVPNVDRVLSQGRLNTYLQRGNSTIIAADNKTGVVRWLLDTHPGTFAFMLTNADDDVVYLVKRNGETQAMRERTLIKPAPAKAAP